MTFALVGVDYQYPVIFWVKRGIKGRGDKRRCGSVRLVN